MEKVIFFCFFALVCGQKSYIVDDSVGLGRQYDGIGGLSGGGATSKLLVNYPEKQRAEILDYLFKPNFAASLQILKVEIGGDSQSTDGTESSHMHESWDENYQRGYEWWLMVEAKKRNPDIKLYGLPWGFPGWVGNGTGSPYSSPNLTSSYIIKWIQGAKTHYNLDIDYIGIWNERNYDITYIEALHSALVQNKLGHIKLVAADGGWGISKDVLKNPTLANAVDIIGCHYPGTYSNNDSVKTNKPLWASEDYSTYNDEVGAGCWARILNQNYVNGYMTSTISWNLIASYYEALPFGRDGLMTAQEPWSGHYVVQDPIWVSAHTTQFTELGWRYLKHGSGVGHLQGGGSYVTLISPNKKQFTMVIETMSHDHSICIRPALPPYKVQPQRATFTLKGSLANVTQLYVWHSALKFDGNASKQFQKLDPVKVEGGQVSLDLEVDGLYTLTTLNTGNHGSYPEPPPSADFPLPYKDNFDSYSEYQEAYNFVPQVGVWEVRESHHPSTRKVNRQVMISPPINWCQAGDTPTNLGGSVNWTDLFIQADILVPSANGTSGVFLAARINKGGCGVSSASGVFYYAFPSKQGDTFFYMVTNDTVRKTVLASGFHKAALQLDEWHHMSLIVRGDRAYGFMGTDQVFSIEVTGVPAKGFAGYGTVDYGIADFDDLSIESSGHLTVIKPSVSMLNTQNSIPKGGRL